MGKNSLLNRRFKYTYNNVVLWLVAINAIMFLLSQIFKNLTFYLALNPILVVHYNFYWQFLTQFFMHGSFSHLFFNMFALYMFGSNIEKNIGSKEFTLFYFTTGLLTSVASFALYYLMGQNVFLLGASGVVYALLLLFAVLFPHARVLLFGIIPLRAPVLVMLYFVIEFISQFRMDGISHYAHLFGFLFSFIYIVVRMKINPIKIFQNK